MAAALHAHWWTATGLTDEIGDAALYEAVDRRCRASSRRPTACRPRSRPPRAATSRTSSTFGSARAGAAHGRLVGPDGRRADERRAVRDVRGVGMGPAARIRDHGWTGRPARAATSRRRRTGRRARGPARATGVDGRRPRHPDDGADRGPVARGGPVDFSRRTLTARATGRPADGERRPRHPRGERVPRHRRPQREVAQVPGAEQDVHQLGRPVARGRPHVGRARRWAMRPHRAHRATLGRIVALRSWALTARELLRTACRTWLTSSPAQAWEGACFPLPPACGRRSGGGSLPA
jgi:hypothetical protein